MYKTDTREMGEYEKVQGVSNKTKKYRVSHTKLKSTGCLTQNVHKSSFSQFSTKPGCYTPPLLHLKK